MNATPTKRVFQLQDEHTDVEVSIEQKEGQPTIIQFESFKTNYHLVAETGEFMEVHKIINKIKEML
tara:strand:- start:433 stop:630 length:198 start_codon:yes stop_codon:yes gene_type:complete